VGDTPPPRRSNGRLGEGYFSVSCRPPPHGSKAQNSVRLLTQYNYVYYIVRLYGTFKSSIIQIYVRYVVYPVRIYDTTIWYIYMRYVYIYGTSINTVPLYGTSSIYGASMVRLRVVYRFYTVPMCLYMPMCPHAYVRACGRCAYVRVLRE
jgi:hypothetical protein